MKYLKRTIYLLLPLTLLMSGPLYAEEVKIAFVNVSKVFDESPQVKEAKDRLQNEVDRRKRELLSEEKQLQQLKDKLEREADVMTETEVNRLERDILNRSRKLKNAQTAAREDITLRQNEEFGKLRKLLREVIQDVGKEEKYDLIITEGVVYYSKKVDISDLVLEKLNKLKAQ